MPTTRLVTALLLAAAAGCAGKDADAPPAAPPPSPPAAAQAPAIETASYAAELGVDIAASTRHPSGLYYRDLVVGTGPEVAPGQRISVRYDGTFPNGTRFDRNAAPAPPFSFQVGNKEVIDGWDLGVLGMRVGGKRQLILPPALGYGANDYGPIPGNSILVFTVEVVPTP
jgi:peptidylprolyl isomerase